MPLRSAERFALRTAKMHEKNLTYSLLFGGGAKYANGEDSLFIHDCLKAGLKVYSIPVEIGENSPDRQHGFSALTANFFTTGAFCIMCCTESWRR